MLITLTLTALAALAQIKLQSPALQLVLFLIQAALAARQATISIPPR